MTAPDPVHDLNEVSRSVLIDVLTVLGKYLDRLVVVGGWVPELSFPGRGHIGTIDVDLAVDAGRIPTTAYDTIRQHLFKAGYRPTDLPSRFEREVRGGAGPLLVRLDLIAGEYAGSAREDSHQQVQEMFVWKARGADLAFLSTVEVEVSGVLPEGGRNRVRVRVPSIAAFLCMKAMALYERKKPKDAYDIYFCVANCAEADTLNDLRSLLDHSLIYEGLRKLRSKFMTVQDVGPVWRSGSIPTMSRNSGSAMRLSASPLCWKRSASSPGRLDGIRAKKLRNWGAIECAACGAWRQCRPRLLFTAASPKPPAACEDRSRPRYQDPACSRRARRRPSRRSRSRPAPAEGA